MAENIVLIDQVVAEMDSLYNAGATLAYPRFELE
jgi:hypothetical protein